MSRTLASTFGMIGQVFHMFGSASGTDVCVEVVEGVGILVAIGFGVRDGALYLLMTDSRSLVGSRVSMGVEGAAQAIRKTQTNKWIIRFIIMKYIHQKLNADKFYARLALMTYNGIIHKYRHLLDLPPHTQIVSLLEGNTPLIKAESV